MYFYINSQRKKDLKELDKEDIGKEELTRRSLTRRSLTRRSLTRRSLARRTLARWRMARILGTALLVAGLNILPGDFRQPRSYVKMLDSGASASGCSSKTTLRIFSYRGPSNKYIAFIELKRGV